MEQVLFKVGLVLVMLVIYFVTGRNKRQIDKIPDGMALMCPSPAYRYVMYALGVIVFVMLIIFSGLYIMDGAPEGAGFVWSLMAIGVVFLVIMLLCGNMAAKECVYFNYEIVQMEKVFRRPKSFRWQDVGKMKGRFENAISLYLLDGTKILTVRPCMVNYDFFCEVFKQECPQVVKGYYGQQRYENPQKCVMKYGTEYYFLSWMGIAIMFMYVAIIFSCGYDEFQRMISQSKPSEWYSLFFAPVCGVAGIICLFIISNTKVHYSQEKVTLKYPLRKKSEIYWMDLRKIKVVTGKKRGEIIWKKVWLYTAEKGYKLNVEFLTYGQDAFKDELLEMAERYNILFEEKSK